MPLLPTGGAAAAAGALLAGASLWAFARRAGGRARGAARAPRDTLKASRVMLNANPLRAIKRKPGRV